MALTSAEQLFEALDQGDPERAGRLLDEGADFRTWVRGGMSPFGLTALADECGLLQRMLAAGADPNARDGMGFSALQHAIRGGREAA
ncbi:MAG: hypothetical protein ACT4TC_24845, partial [Myxococcaceae bacterium]